MGGLRCVQFIRVSDGLPRPHAACVRAPFPTRLPALPLPHLEAEGGLELALGQDFID
jgi:hypothetical protein